MKDTRVFIAVNQGCDYMVEAPTLDDWVIAILDASMEPDECTYYYAKPIDVTAKTVLTTTTKLELA